MRQAFCCGLFVSAVAVFAGCSQTKTEPDGPSADGAKYLLTSEPADALGVVDARKQTKDGDAVVIVGRIGGREDPWGNGQATFSVVDLSLLACTDREGDNCSTPWDYCCVPSEELHAGMAVVKIVDEKGNTVQKSAKELLGVKELQTVVVRGKAQRNDNGNLVVLAAGLYVRPEKK
jgi:hypothetical protein